MSVIEERLPYLDTLQLAPGAHSAPNNGLGNACVMEAPSALLLLDRMIEVGKVDAA